MHKNCKIQIEKDCLWRTHSPHGSYYIDIEHRIVRLQLGMVDDNGPQW